MAGDRPARKELTRAQTALVLLIGLAVAGVFGIPYTGYWRESQYARQPLKDLSDALPAHGGDPILHYWAGRRLSEAGQNDEAAKVLEQGVRLQPQEVRLRDAWAQALLSSGRSAEAYGQLKEFTASNPNKPQAHFLLGKIALTLGNDKEAVPALQQALKLDPKLAEAWSLLAEAQNRAHTPDEAITSLRRALELDPKRPGDLTFLGKLLQDKDLTSAIAPLQKSVDLRPNDSYTRGLLAQVLFRSGKPQEAEKHATEGLRLNPDEPQCNLILGDIKIQSNTFDEAEKYLLQAARLAPFETTAATSLVQLYSRTKNTARLAEWKAELKKRTAWKQEELALHEGLVQDPMNPELNRKMAKLQAQKGNVEESIHRMAIALKQPLESSEVLRAVAGFLRESGLDSAADSLEQRIR